MLSDKRVAEIHECAEKVNRMAEGYQLIHACFAVQKIINERINNLYAKKFDEIRSELSDDSIDMDKATQLLEEKRRLEMENRKKRISISVRYISSLKGMNARTTCVGTYKNSFVISLPEELSCIRDESGEFDYDKMRGLRWLMAHELGHIILHTENINEDGFDECDTDKEEESNCFAKKILELRRERNKKLFDDKNFDKF